MADRDDLICQTCYVTFPDREVLREHYTTTFHAYNAKRRSGGLPPVTWEAFEARRQAAVDRAQAAARAAVPMIYRITSSGREFNSLGALASHLRAKKVQAALAALPSDSSRADIDALRQFCAAPDTAPLPPHVAARPAKEPAAPVDPAATGGAGEGGAAGAGAAAAGAAAGPGASHAPEAELAGPLNLPRNHPDRHLEERLAEASIHNMCFLDCEPVESAVQCLDRCCDKHGFIVPDEAYLTDVMGLLQYCAEKVLVGMTCLYCNATFSSVTATQAHMTAKRHGKLPFDRDRGEDMEEYDQFYDFDQDVTYTGSNGQEVVSLAYKELTVDEAGHLLLPDGRTVGHRAFKRYYDQHQAKPDTRAAIVAASADKRAKIAKALASGNSEALVAVGMGRRHDHIAGLSKWVATGAMHVTRVKLQKQLDAGQKADIAASRIVQERHGKAGNRNQRLRFFQQYMGAG